MVKPRLIILIRHAQSEGNKNRDIHQTIPDHRVKLTPEGWQQAYEAGRRLKDMLRPDDTLHFFTSPYRRTRETTEGILSTLTGDGSPFQRPNIKVYEEPRLREQDFGNFQPCSAEMERMWQERADYGHFFYRIPNGESAADAYDRISGFNESLWRQFGEDDFASVCVLVTHGLMSRVFLMKWYHFTVEYFEDLRNVNHCEFLIMNKDEHGKYILQNKLRTWSELRRERELLLREKEAQDKDSQSEATRDANHKDATKLPRSKSTVIVRRWGGCPNGCNHSRHFSRNPDLELLRQKDEQGATKHSTELANAGRANSTLTHMAPSAPPAAAPPAVTNGTSMAAVTRAPGEAPGRPPLLVRRSTRRAYNSDDDDPNDPLQQAPATIAESMEQLDIQRAQDELVSSPDATPSFISPEDRLRSMLSPEPAEAVEGLTMRGRGRDGGGSLSGHTSRATTDDEGRQKKSSGSGLNSLLVRAAKKSARAVAGASVNEDADDEQEEEEEQGVISQELLDQSGMGRGARANRLGDGGSGSDADDLEAAEKMERGIRGSVY
ncbi:hypothetical protein TD95_000790 [Thielaviopsis punctulata]|uniref:Uncharacterized protein n=1 Tax=Thielaviopsis punctulata TaxID=72032 RepID=A0A0F4ZN06_9PEZI|nr:hypothetical protein TD95_000790 [Thielaviopsis punctulata]